MTLNFSVLLYTYTYFSHQSFLCLTPLVSFTEQPAKAKRTDMPLSSQLLEGCSVLLMREDMGNFLSPLYDKYHLGKGKFRRYFSVMGVDSDDISSVSSSK